MKKIYLTIDFGSTYTKLTAIDLERETILGTSKAITTVETGIMLGFYEAFETLKKDISKKLNIEESKIEFIKKTACSSAAGGLKMIAIGLVPELTTDAAKKAALGAGARVIKTYAFELNSHEMEEIKNSNLDIILLAGGTDGGNHECIIHNAKMIVEHKIEVPIVVAGNKSAVDVIEKLFNEAGIYYKISENVMPILNKLNVEPTREAIRQVFMQKIVEAKGMGEAEEFTSGILMPTPAAVLKAAEILSVGSDVEDGIGDILVVDIGGATTDIHSISKGLPTKPAVILKGLEEPFVKRTVEGDLGMRYSSLALLEAGTSKRITSLLEDKYKHLNPKEMCEYRYNNIKMVPMTDEDLAFDEAMAKVATDIAMERHCGVLEVIYTPMGSMFSQLGKDLLETPLIIGTGGVIVHSKNPNKILEAGIFNPEKPINLKPIKPKYWIDKTYILSSMGLLAEDYPDLSIRLMKKYLLEV